MSCYLAVGSRNNSEVEKTRSRCLDSETIRGGEPQVKRHSAGKVCCVYELNFCSGRVELASVHVPVSEHLPELFSLLHK